MLDAFRITSMVPGLPERVYSAWLDSHAHAAFTGASARIDPSIGGKFSVLDGSVSGRTVELLPGRRIVQTWRAKEFPSGSRDSRLEIQFEGTEGATRVTIMHSALPPGQGERLKQAWIMRYFQPLRAYFAGLIPGRAPAGRPPRATVTDADHRPAPAKAKVTAKPTLKVTPKKSSSKPRKTNPSRKGSVKTAARRPVVRKGRH
jgi:uncharacterized protein YndB with AHSA1/START domain